MSAHAQTLLDNGDFLHPSPPAGTFVLIDSGERYGAWRVVGVNGNVAFVSGRYQHHGLSFISAGQSAGKRGSSTATAWVNLAGISQSATGIAHAPIPTTPGNSYTLSFYVGNMYAPGDVYGTTSTVNVWENSTLLGTFTNSGGQGTSTENWQQFSVTFPADAPYTTIAFLNGDPPGDMNCGIDDIVLAVASQPGRHP